MTTEKMLLLSRQSFCDYNKKLTFIKQKWAVIVPYIVVGYILYTVIEMKIILVSLILAQWSDHRGQFWIVSLLWVKWMDFDMLHAICKEKFITKLCFFSPFLKGSIFLPILF